MRPGRRCVTSSSRSWSRSRLDGMGIRDMVVAVKQIWNGKVAGAPNFQPLFWASSNMGLGTTYAQSVQTQPGRYHTWVYSACQSIIQPFIDLPAVMYDQKNEEKL